MGIVKAAALGVLVFDDGLGAAGVLGMALIIAGVAVLNILSYAYAGALTK